MGKIKNFVSVVKAVNNISRFDNSEITEAISRAIWSITNVKRKFPKHVSISGISFDGFIVKVVWTDGSTSRIPFSTQMDPHLVLAIQNKQNKDKTKDGGN